MTTFESRFAIGEEVVLDDGSGGKILAVLFERDALCPSYIIKLPAGSMVFDETKLKLKTE